MRIVFDTNVLVSAFLSKKGKPFTALRWAGEYADVISCRQAIDELSATLGKKKLAVYLSEGDRVRQISLYENAVEMIEVPNDHGVTASRDDDDNLFLALASIGNADFLISGDDDLLSLGTYEGIPIMKVADFLERVGA
jgi:uncharacterized protein